MSRPSTTNTNSSGGHHPPGVTTLLAFAASPVFGLMAWIAASNGSAMPFCGALPGSMPISGMTTMYLLMSLFHVSPWLKLASGHPWSRTLLNFRGDRS